MSRSDLIPSLDHEVWGRSRQCKHHHDKVEGKSLILHFLTVFHQVNVLVTQLDVKLVSRL